MPDTHPGRQHDIRSDERTRLVRLAYRFVCNLADAEDAVHDALAVEAVKQGQLRDPGKRWSWLCRIVVRRCLHVRRGQKREATHKAVLARRRPNHADDAGSVERGERATMMHWAMQQLPEQQRIAMTLRHLEGMSYEEAANVMELAASTVRVHVMSARERLRELLVGRDPEWGAIPPSATRSTP